MFPAFLAPDIQGRDGGAGRVVCTTSEYDYEADGSAIHCPIEGQMRDSTRSDAFPLYATRLLDADCRM